MRINVTLELFLMQQVEIAAIYIYEVELCLACASVIARKMSKRKHGVHILVFTFSFYLNLSSKDIKVDYKKINCMQKSG